MTRRRRCTPRDWHELRRSRPLEQATRAAPDQPTDQETRTSLPSMDSRVPSAEVTHHRTPWLPTRPRGQEEHYSNQPPGNTGRTTRGRDPTGPEDSEAATQLEGKSHESSRPAGDASNLKADHAARLNPYARTTTLAAQGRTGDPATPRIATNAGPRAPARDWANRPNSDFCSEHSKVPNITYQERPSCASATILE